MADSRLSGPPEGSRQASGHLRHASDPVEGSGGQETPQRRSTPPTSPGHIRRISEPPEGDRVLHSVHGSPVRRYTDRRTLFERHWSTSNLSGNHTLVRGVGGTTSSRDARDRSSNATQTNRPTIAELAQFQATWTNSNGADFLGATTPAAFAPSSPVVWGHQSSSGSFDFGTVERPEMARRMSSASPRVDSTGLSSVIHDAARITDWDKVLQLCGSNPECAKYTGRDGWTALHHACNRRCPRPEVVEALIRAYPDALLKEDEKGWCPLHYACRFKAPKEVVRLLLHMYPDKGRVGASRRDRLGRTSLYYAIRYDAPPGVVGLLLEVDPSVVLEEDQNEDSPLALVWDSWAEKLEAKRIIHSFLPGHYEVPEGTTEEERLEMLRQRLKKESKLCKRWQKVNVLLKAAFGFPVDEEEASDDEDETKESSTRKWRIVHATAAVKCHVSLFLLACALHPEQLRELDESDLRRPGDSGISGASSHQTVLHLAASSNADCDSGKIVVHTILGQYPEAAQVQDGLDGSLPLHRMVENECKQNWPKHVALLHESYPQGVRVQDRKGKLALHRAAAAITHVDRESEEELAKSVIIQLVRNYPEAASRADRSGCFPLHLIAMHGEVWDREVDAVYEAHPNAVQARASASMDNRLPIHMASASTDSRKSLIERLAEKHPRGASLTDRKGKLPLHLACELGKEWDAGVCSIHEAFPAAVQRAEENSRGWMALHMASACANASAGLIKKLAELHPEAAGVADNDGNFPLHLACRSGKDWKGGLESLFEAYPSAVASRNNAGLLPLHVAALQYCASDAEEEGEEANDAQEADDADKLDILFNLLRADPMVIEN